MPAGVFSPPRIEEESSMPCGMGFMPCYDAKKRTYIMFTVFAAKVEAE